MPILLCPSCGVANADTAPVCHTCSGLLPAARLSAVAVPVGGYALAAAPGGVTGHRATRHREAKTASRALQAAAWLLVLRGTILPILMNGAARSSAPAAGEPASPSASMLAVAPPGTSPSEVRVHSYVAAALMAVLCVWARKNPLPAAATAAVLYAGLCVPDLVHGVGLLGKGVIGKAITFLTIGRAVAAGVVYALTPDASGPADPLE